MNDLEYLKKYYNGNINDAIERLKNGEPAQYIVGDVDFYGNIIKVDNRVLIPRRETEELVEKTLRYLSNTNLNIVDLGTGSGCIAITLKKKLPNVIMDAVDISSNALDLAKENAKLNNVNINFYCGDMLNPLDKKYDCIISNPPYLSFDADVMDIVKNNEPHLALYASNNGLYFYDEILKKGKKYLKNKFLIAFEIGYDQGEELFRLSKKYYPNANIKIEKDLQGYDRFCFISGEL